MGNVLGKKSIFHWKMWHIVKLKIQVPLSQFFIILGIWHHFLFIFNSRSIYLFFSFFSVVVFFCTLVQIQDIDPTSALQCSNIGQGFQQFEFFLLFMNFVFLNNYNSFQFLSVFCGVHHALNPIIKAEKILPQILLDATHYFHFGQHILVLKKQFKAQFLRNY